MKLWMVMALALTAPMAWAQQATTSEAPAAETTEETAAESPAGPRVELMTSKGPIVVELYPDRAPESVRNFLAYVDDGFYEGTIFHRVMDRFMIQGGGFSEELVKKRTRDPIVNEADNGLTNDRGTLAMARTSSPHSATAQFYINLVDNVALDHRSKDSRGWGYAVFGRVVEGMVVVDAIAKVPTGSKGTMRNVPIEPVRILRATALSPAEQPTAEQPAAE